MTSLEFEDLIYQIETYSMDGAIELTEKDPSDIIDFGRRCRNLLLLYKAVAGYSKARAVAEAICKEYEETEK